MAIYVYERTLTEPISGVKVEKKWAELLCTGTKTCEVRHNNTNIKGFYLLEKINEDGYNQIRCYLPILGTRPVTHEEWRLATTHTYHRMTAADINRFLLARSVRQKCAAIAAGRFDPEDDVPFVPTPYRPHFWHLGKPDFSDAGLFHRHMPHQQGRVSIKELYR